MRERIAKKVSMENQLDPWAGALRLSVAARFFQRSGRFMRLLGTRFVEDQGLVNAASLAYATLLALVPLMTVFLAIFAAFPISERVAEEVQSFVFENFVPTSGEVLQEYLQEFSRKASQLTGTGFGFLIVVALLLMSNIERAFNTIWRVRRKRRPLSRFTMYWAILTLGPLLIGISVAATSYLVSIPFFTDAATTLGFGQRLLALAPMLASAIAFTLLYAVVPNRRVPFRHALAGGVLAALFFELAKQGFAFYLTNFPTYEAIYGVLAVIPIFLVWIYLSWLVTLLGAEFSCCLGLFRDTSCVAEGGRRNNDLLLTLRLLGELRRAQREGYALSSRALSAALWNLTEERLDQLLLDMQEARLLLRTEEHKWVLARDLSDVQLLDLYRMHPLVLQDVAWMQESGDPLAQTLGAILGRIEDELQQAMECSLDDLFKRT